MAAHPRGLFTKRTDWSKHRDPTVQEWLKHFSAKEEEHKKKASVACIPSPKARARGALVLSWYRHGAMPWEEVSWTNYIPGLPKAPVPVARTFPLTKMETYLHLIHGKLYEDLDALLLHLGESPPPSEVVDLCFIRAYPPLFLLCLKHGANPNRSLKGGLTFLHVAAHKGENSMMRGICLLSVCSVLLRYTTDVNRACDGGLTPLHLACQPFIPCFHKGEIIGLLLHHGADVNARDGTGKTPLHYAVHTGGASSVAMLLKAGADVCLEDNKGRLPIDMASDAMFRVKALQLFSSSLPKEEVRRMHAKRLSRQFWTGVVSSFKTRCPKCRRYLEKCKARKRTQQIWWLWSHGEIPH